MLTCLQCQFENPDQNKFCQSCGASLTHQTCPECSAQVPLEALNCQECGARTGTTWRAIFTVSTNPSAAPEGVAQPVAEEDITVPLFSAVVPRTTAKAGVAVNTPDQQRLETLPLDYLDPQQRYQVLEPLQLLPGYPNEYETLVLDRQPLQKTVLQALQKQDLSPETLLEESQLSLVPPMAQLYLTLNLQLYQTLPSIQDAWFEDNKTILLLEDRSDWLTLIDWWRDRSIPPQQVLYIFNETLKLWTALEPFGCCQSLLKLDNILIDEDEILGLRRLYWESNPTTVMLKQLGQVWQQFLEQSDQAELAAIAGLVQSLLSEEIDTLDQLRHQLKLIDLELQGEDIPAYFAAAEDDLDIDSDAPTEIPDTPYNQRMMGAQTQIQSLTAERNSDILDDLPTVVLPMQLFSLEDSGLTDTGRQRDRNEDAYLIQTQIHRIEHKTGRSIHAQGLYILCDGMGGHAGGEVASSLAVDTLTQYFQEHWLGNPEKRHQLPNHSTILEGVRHANQVIYEMNQKQSRTGSGRMGTTLVLVLVQDTQWAVAHVGDSRLYSYTRKQGLKLMTQDHDVAHREIQRGVDPTVANSRPDAFQLTQALGPRGDDHVNPDIQFLEFNEDMILLLSSDGLTDNDLVEKHHLTHLAPLISSRASLDRGANDLIELANQHNGHDNITTLLIRAKVRPNLGNIRE